jgi:hypothetical protein
MFLAGLVGIFWCSQEFQKKILVVVLFIYMDSQFCHIYRRCHHFIVLTVKNKNSQEFLVVPFFLTAVIRFDDVGRSRR